MTNKEAIEKLKEILFMTGYKEALDLAIRALEDRPQGDLISREALKEALKSNCTPEICHDYGTNWCEACCPHNDFEDLIDSVPTVDIKDELAGAYNEGYMCGSREAEKARPQGEWIEKVERRGCFAGDKTVYSYTCPFCGAKEFKKYPFCHCGADMRKGGAE